LGQARGPLLELDTHLMIALDLNYLKAEDSEALEHDVYQVLGLLPLRHRTHGNLVF